MTSEIKQPHEPSLHITNMMGRIPSHTQTLLLYIKILHYIRTYNLTWVIEFSSHIKHKKLDIRWGLWLDISDLAFGHFTCVIMLETCQNQINNDKINGREKITLNKIYQIWNKTSVKGMKQTQPMVQKTKNKQRVGELLDDIRAVTYIS